MAGALAAENGTDASLVRGIMIAENLQRPRWFRRLERIKGRGPISDEESVRRAVGGRLSGVQVLGADGNVDYTLLTAIAQRWNPDPTFVDLLWAGYFEARQRS